MSQDPATPGPFPENPPLSVLEARVVGSLIEKEFSTPDVYPLSLNALVNACNQRNNRAPILSAGSREVEVALEHLRQRRLVSLVAGGDARVPKFRQTMDASYPMENVARALVGELLLRGPQTAAALRANAERLQPMPDAAEIDRVLADLSARPAGALVSRLPRQSGQKEARWAQLFTGDPLAAAGVDSPGDSTRQAEPLTVSISLPPDAEVRIATLEMQVSDLRAELTRLRDSLGGG